MRSRSASYSVTQVTPYGPGAIATLRVEGPGSLDAVGSFFRTRSGTPLKDCPTGRPILGLFEPGEPVVAHRCSDDAVELHCHGGLAAVDRICRGLVDRGGESLPWQSWVRRRAADPIAAEARLALAEANTQRTAAILLDQFAGALGRAMADLERLLAAGKRADALALATALLGRSTLGQHLTQPWRVVLAGRPNAGKSSLLNALLGYERAIVHPTSGTTRDVVSASTAIDGWPVELMDTAGLSSLCAKGSEAVLARGMALAREQMAAADLVVLVFDRAIPLSAEEWTWVANWPNALCVDNKCDLPPSPGRRPPAISLSALTGEGLTRLLREISRRLVPDEPAPGAAIPFTEAQRLHVQSLASRCSGD